MRKVLFVSPPIRGRMRGDVLLNCCNQSLVDAAHHAAEEDACCAEGEDETGVAVALEGRQRSLCLVDVHALHNLQIVVE